MKLAKTYNVNIEYKVYNIAREALLLEYGKIEKQLKKIPPPQNLLESIQFKKLLKVIGFVAFHNNLQYQGRKELSYFVKDLINS